MDLAMFHFVSENIYRHKQKDSLEFFVLDDCINVTALCTLYTYAYNRV